MNQKEVSNRLPVVSVIIPFFNNHDDVVRIERRVQNQTYPSNLIETIFIDNGSTDSFNFSESFLNRNTVLFENARLNSPYSARNRGIEQSKGEIIAFIDANSTPDDHWLEEGVACIMNYDANIAGGKVDFDFQENRTAAKIVDSLTSIDMKKAIRERGVAYTANLFVKREVFDDIGTFEEGVRSGGDVRWSLKAGKADLKIGYCEKSIVKKYARSVMKLYGKKIRTGKGYYHTWKNEPDRKIWFYNFLRSLKPPTPSKIRQLNTDRYQSEYDEKMAAIWFHLYVSGIAEQLAFIGEYFRNKIKSS